MASIRESIENLNKIAREYTALKNIFEGFKSNINGLKQETCGVEGIDLNDAGDENITLMFVGREYDIHFSVYSDVISSLMGKITFSTIKGKDQFGKSMKGEFASISYNIEGEGETDDSDNINLLGADSDIRCQELVLSWLVGEIELEWVRSDRR